MVAQCISDKLAIIILAAIAMNISGNNTACPSPGRTSTVSEQKDLLPSTGGMQLIGRQDD